MATARLTDSILVTGGGDFLLSGSFNYDFSVGGNGCSPLNQIRFFFTYSGTINGGMGADITCQGFAGTSELNQVVSLLSGAELFFNAFVSAQAHMQFQSASAVVLASETLHFYLTPLTAGAAYSTGSGLGYEHPNNVPVPEPVTLLLLGTGLGAFAVQRGLKTRA